LTRKGTVVSFIAGLAKKGRRAEGRRAGGQEGRRAGAGGQEGRSESRFVTRDPFFEISSVFSKATNNYAKIHLQLYNLVTFETS
jgi:hypothetical protein